ncbi:MAG: hypothetical protein KDA61_21895, partial [Planctomycetales bacterium]|nr:hypothetical protein [Planctomycetales bacterium]
EWEMDGVVRTAILPSNREERTLDLGGPAGARVAGRLLRDGEPQAGISMQLGGENSSFGVFKAFTSTDDEGRFTFTGVPAGRRVLWQRAAGNRHQFVRLTDLDISLTGAVGTTIDLGDVKAPDATVRVNVTGLALEESATLHVRLQQFDPLWIGAGGVAGVATPRQSLADPFEFTGVAVGSYEAIVSRGEGVARLQPIELPAETNEMLIDVAWPSEVGKLEMRFKGIEPDKLSMVSANIRSADGSVMAQSRPSRAGEQVQTIEGLPPGDYFVTDFQLRNARRLQEFAIKSGETTTIEIDGDSLTREDKNLGLLVVTWYGHDGIPCPGVPGRLVDEDGKEAGVITRRSAKWSIVAPVGRYRLLASPPGYAPVERDVEVVRIDRESRESTTHEIDVLLAAPAQ